MLKPLSLANSIVLLSSIFKDPERKSVPIIIGEAILMAFRQRCIPMHYITRYLYKKDHSNIFNSFSDKYLTGIRSGFNDREVSEVLENKLYFNLFYGQFDISLPKILMYNHKNMFVVRDRVLCINNSQDFKLILTSLISDNDPESSIFIKKTYGTYGGKRIYKINQEQLALDTDFIDNLYEEVIKAGYLFQETICQHPDMDKLNPSCNNTIRLDTFIDHTGKAEIISSYVRMAFNNLHVDNISSGGCAVKVNLNTGQLEEFGYQSLSLSHGKRTTEHPFTKTVFKDFKIPEFEKAKELVLKAASLMPGLRLIGWDVSLSTTGPVLIEGNSYYDITGSDLLYGGYGSNPVFRKVLEEYNHSKWS
ncbi:MAG: hypothetical protein GZ094_11120 [Mariniphaga sp.]|nr:hypothetical protein [Mariniphaga sp.]